MTLMPFRVHVAALSLCLSPCLNPSVALGAGSHVTIDDAKVSGSGCSELDTTLSVSPDQQAITLFFSAFSLFTEVDHRNKLEKQKACELQMRVNAPAGWSYTVVGVDTRGYSSLGPKSTATISTSLKTEGSGWQNSPSTTIRGPVADEFLASSRFNSKQFVWSACHSELRRFAIRTNLNLSSAPRNGDLVSVDSLDSELAERFVIQWRECDLSLVQAESYALGLYHHLIGPTVVSNDTDLVANWSAGFKSSRNRENTARNAVFSQEHRLVEADYWYQQYFGRHGSPSEISKSVSHGDADQIRNELLASAEFYSLSGQNFDGFMNRLYQVVYAGALAPDLVAWRKLQGLGRSEIARRVMWDNSARVALLQNMGVRVLGRVLSNTEAQDMLKGFGGRMTNYPTLLIELLRTNEFFNLVVGP